MPLGFLHLRDLEGAMGWLTPVGLNGPAEDSGHWTPVTKQILRLGLNAQASVLPSRLNHSFCED